MIDGPVLTDEAREALVQAALRGTEQCFGHVRDGDARCAMGAITEALNGIPGWSDRVRPRVFVRGPMVTCPATAHDGAPCGRQFLRSPSLLVHLNDSHRWDFLTIATKLG